MKRPDDVCLDTHLLEHQERGLERLHLVFSDRGGLPPGPVVVEVVRGAVLKQRPDPVEVRRRWHDETNLLEIRLVFLQPPLDHLALLRRLLLGTVREEVVVHF